MKKFLTLLCLLAMAVFANAQTNPVDLKGNLKDGFLVFTFENNSGKTIANCNFQLQLPEGVTLKPKGKKYAYEEGDATEGMTFSVAYNATSNKYTITVYDGEFDESAGNTIITLPLEGELTGEATVSSIAIGDPDANNICRPEAFTIKLGGEVVSNPIDIFGKVENGSLVFRFKNNSGKTISNCNFQLQLPEGVTLKPKGKKYAYVEGNATEGMTFSVAYNSTSNKYTIAVYDGEFDESLGNTIISLPLEGTSGGEATVSQIAFGDSDAQNICRPANFTIAIPSITPPTPTGSVDLKGEVKDGNLVFTFENKSGKTIANCNFQFVLPKGVSVKLNPVDGDYKFEKGDATKDMRLSVAFNKESNKYTIVVYGGEFDENAGNTIIAFPLEGTSGGKATVSNIAFGDSDANNICRPKYFIIDIPSITPPAPTGSVELKGEVKDGNLVFTFENNSSKTIANCNFQFILPDGMSVKLDSAGKRCLYEKGDATEDMEFFVAFRDGRYTITVLNGEFDETAGNTIITLPLQGKSGGKATVSTIAFGDSDGNNISRPNGFTLDIPSAPVGDVDLTGEVRNGKLVFMFENTTGEPIGVCNFQFVLPEGVSLKKNSTGKKYLYEEGDATEGMSFYLASNDNKYNISVFGGEFDEAAGNTIISLSLQGRKGGQVSVSSIAFGSPDGSNIGRPEDFTLDIPSADKGNVDLNGEVKDGNLIFTFENTSGKTIANCNFQFVLPEGVSVKPKGKKYAYKEGDATEGMTFSVAYNSTSNKYTIAVFGSEFDETAGNTIITLPLEGIMAGEATVSSIAFGDPNANNISRPDDFTMAIIGVDLKGEIKDNNLVFTFENNTGKSISNCNFQFILPEGMSLISSNDTRLFMDDMTSDLSSVTNGNTYYYNEGDATAGMTFSIECNNDVYTVAVFGGEFDETAGNNTIISLPLQGKSGGEASVSDITFEDTENNRISQSEGFTIDVDGVEMNGVEKDGSLVFTFENTSGKAIASCNFQFTLPEGISLIPNGESYFYEEGNATAGMKFYITSSNNVYTVTVYDGEFNEIAGNTIISLPLQGSSKGIATVSNIAFSGSDGSNISRPDDLIVTVEGDEDPDVQGDLTGDGEINVADLNRIRTIIANRGTVIDYPAADLTGDGEINVADLNRLRTIIATK